MERGKGGAKRCPLSGMLKSHRTTDAEWNAKEPPPKGQLSITAFAARTQNKKPKMMATEGAMEVDGGVRLGAGCGNWGAEADEKAEFFAAHFIYPARFDGKAFAQPPFHAHTAEACVGEDGRAVCPRVEIKFRAPHAVDAMLSP